MRSDQERLKQLVHHAREAGFSSRPDPWLADMTYSQAFVACVGAGPWRLPRRTLIQRTALHALGRHDLADKVAIPYPLDWQNRCIAAMRSTLKQRGLGMEEFCPYLKQHGGRFILYQAAGSPNGTKVLSLFCRDALQIRAFPIDRHVRRLLDLYDLPTKETDVIELCASCGLNPTMTATLLVRYGSKDPVMNARNLLDKQ